MDRMDGPPALPAFSLDDYVNERARSTRELQLVAEVFEDGTHYVLRPSPSQGGSAYRVAKSSVTIGPQQSDVPTYLLSLERSAPCLRLTGSTVETFFPLGARHALAPEFTLAANITFRANGEGTLRYNGRSVACLGKPNLAYTRDLTVQGIINTDKFRRKYSNEFSVYMDFAILIMGQRGIYIHEGPDNLADNSGPSQGCVHLAQGNAEDFYNFVTEPTRIQIAYPW